MKPKAEVMRDLARVLRRKIVIQRLMTTTNVIGDVVRSWSDWCTVWAERSSLWGRDFFAAAAVGEEQTVEFILRHAPFLDEIQTDTHRIKLDGCAYDIRQVDYLKDDGTWIKIRALRRTAGGE